MSLFEKRKILQPYPTAYEALVLGATAGIVSSNLMTVLRMLARRLGYIDKTVPQAMEEWLLEKLGKDLPEGPVTHHVVDQVLHMSYASGIGALEGFLGHKQIDHALPRGLALGAGTWAFAGLLLLPSLGASKGIWKAGIGENLVNLVAHLIFGVSTSFLTDEFRRQTQRGPAGARERELAKVG